MENYNFKLAQFNNCYIENSFKNFSDGYHTFGELYHHRAILSAAFFNEHKDIAWKSKKHNHEDDEMFDDDMFIVGIQTPEGMATYHYHIEPYWHLFDVPELEEAPKWDGHTPDEAINRIKNMIKPKEDD